MNPRTPRRHRLPAELTAEDLELAIADEKRTRPAPRPWLLPIQPNQKRIDQLEARLRNMRFIGK